MMKWTSRRDRRTLMGCAGPAALALAVMISTSLGTARAETADWIPAIGGHLVLLPPEQIRDAVEQDFDQSALAARIAAMNDRISRQRRDVDELRAAMTSASGTALLDTRRQELRARRHLVRMLGQRLESERAGWATRLSLYAHLLGRTAAADAAAEIRSLSVRQGARPWPGSTPRESDENAPSNIGDETDPAQRYANLERTRTVMLEKLRAHPMRGPTGRGDRDRDGADGVRRLIDHAKSMLMVLDKEIEVLGIMAELVALDALALAVEERDSPPEQAATGHKPETLESAVDLFLK